MKKGSQLAASIRASVTTMRATMLTAIAINSGLGARAGRVFLTEALNTSGRIDNLLFAGIERMAL